MLLQLLLDKENSILPNHFIIGDDDNIIGTAEHGSHEYYQELDILGELEKDYRFDGAIKIKGYRPKLCVDKKWTDELYFGIVS